MPSAKRLVLCEPYPLFGNFSFAELVPRLEQNLSDRGVTIDTIRIPIINQPGSENFGQELAAWCLIAIEHSYNEQIDAVLSLGFPTYWIQHQRHIAWLISPPPWLEPTPQLLDFWPSLDPDSLQEPDLITLAGLHLVLPSSERHRERLQELGLTNLGPILPIPDAEAGWLNLSSNLVELLFAP